MPRHPTLTNYCLDDVDGLISRLDKISSPLVSQIRPYVEQIRLTMQYASAAGVTRPLLFHPLIVGSHNEYFKDGVLVEVVRRTKRTDVLAAGGRYA